MTATVDEKGHNAGSRNVTRATAALATATTSLLVISAVPALAAPTSVAHVAVAPAGSWSDCVGTISALIAARFGGGAKWVSASSYVFAATQIGSCISWTGGKNAQAICWGSRQWWGYGERAKVLAFTFGKYSRC